MAKKGDTNASPSAYGWVFQVGAGITLMLDNVKDFTSMKDNNMNIEIFLKYRNNKLTPPLQYAMMGFNLCHIVGFHFVKMGKKWVNSVIRSS